MSTHLLKHRTGVQRVWAAPDSIRSRTERGAALVEAAIVFIPLCIIVFGIIEYGFVFKDSLTLSSATRAGARTASAESRQGTSPHTFPDNTFLADTVAATSTAAAAGTFTIEDQMWIYSADASGSPLNNGCVNTTTTCAVFTYVGGTGGVKNTPWQYTSGGWDPQTQQACLGSAMDSVGVRLTLHHKAVSGFFQNLLLHERTVMRLEPTNSACP